MPTAELASRVERRGAQRVKAFTDQAERTILRRWAKARALLRRELTDIQLD